MISGYASTRLMITLESLSTLPPLTFALVYEIHSPRTLRERSDFSFIEHFDWGLLEARLLALPRPPTSLRFVVLPRFKGAAGVNINWIEDAIRPRLPELDAGGLLSFQLGEDP